MPAASARNARSKAAEWSWPTSRIRSFSSTWTTGSPQRRDRRDATICLSARKDRKKLYVVALELKSSGFRAVPVSRQLAGGAKTATAVVGKAPCRFVPVVAHDGAHRSQIDKLAKHPVRFRRRSYAIKLMKCGEYLADALA